MAQKPEIDKKGLVVIGGGITGLSTALTWAINHDVKKVPFPIQADLMYSRFLLSHLSNVIELINLWVKELKTGGLLIVEELEGIHTDVTVFKQYIEITNALLASQKASLYVGDILAKGNYEADILSNEHIYL